MKTAAVIDYKERALQFTVGSTVVPVDYSSDQVGRVVAVHPAIGMVDVEFSNGQSRHPAEDLQLMVDGQIVPYPLPEGSSADRVARAFLKRALYWAGADRKYRMTRSEEAEGALCCPKCGKSPLQKATYKREDGVSNRLLGCKGCLFLVKTCDILNHPDNL